MNEGRDHTGDRAVRQRIHARSPPCHVGGLLVWEALFGVPTSLDHPKNERQDPALSLDRHTLPRTKTGWHEKSHRHAVAFEWSGKRGSNFATQPWQGCATNWLFPQICLFQTGSCIGGQRTGVWSGETEARQTRDLNLGKVALYQLSYSANLSFSDGLTALVGSAPVFGGNRLRTRDLNLGRLRSTN